MNQASAVPVIAIDGPSASGKGTVAELVARELGFRYLDSGALYRAAGLAARCAGVRLDDAQAVADAARAMDVSFAAGRVRLDGEDVSDALRTEACGRDASTVAAIPAVRAALLQGQRDFRRAPGLVADGRDMGSVVFPDARLKIYLTAAAAVRAQRRHKQLMDKGIHARVADLLKDIEERDARDRNRVVAPLLQSADASVLDTSHLTVDDAVEEVLRRFAAVAGR
jgi:cytidylate kinase